MNKPQNKAPQTLAVRGNADNPLVNGLSFVANVMQVIDQLANNRFRKLQFNPDFCQQYAHARVIIANYAQINVRVSQHKMYRVSRPIRAGACARDYIKISPCENPSKPMVKTLAQLGDAAYNATSLKSRQHPATESQFFCTLFMTVRFLAHGLQSMAGVLGNSNVPTVLDGESTTATLFKGDAFKSQNLGGHHA